MGAEVDINLLPHLMQETVVKLHVSWHASHSKIECIKHI